LYWIVGQDTPPVDATPFKAYLVAAQDEEAARQLLPIGFFVETVRLIDDAVNRPASLIGWHGSRTPLIEGEH
jgi:hypothetical protein